VALAELVIAVGEIMNSEELADATSRLRHNCNPMIVPEKSQNNLGDEFLIGGDDYLFKQAIPQCAVYAEYGCDKSTVWAGKNFPAFLGMSSIRVGNAA